MHLFDRVRLSRLAVVILGCIAVISSCTKIDETELGNGLIPPIDGINTFDTVIDVVANSYFQNDTLYAIPSDSHVFGFTNDPTFGKSDYRTYMEMMPDYFGAIPFKDSVTNLDSVVLNLQIAGYYGDTLSPQTINVQELAPSSMVSSRYYRYDTTFTTLAPIASPKLVDPRQLKDTIIVLNKIGDTSKRVNVIRFKLDNAFASRLFTGDSVKYVNDTNYRTLFGGLGIFSSSTNSRGHFKINPQDPGNAIEFYYRSIQNGKADTAVTSFHFRGGQANTVHWDTVGSAYAAQVRNPAGDSLVYIKANPGSFVWVKIPALSTLTNRVIHRAELIVEQVADVPAGSPFDLYFRGPNLLHLEAIDTFAAYKFRQIPYDFYVTSSGPNYSTFGGYRTSVFAPSGNYQANYFFNITNYVQGVITRKERNYDLRILAPYKTSFGYLYNNLGEGRMVAGGTKHSQHKMRLRLIYSKL